MTRRAKHSSMTVLSHLHNPTAPTFVITCNVCHNDVETGQGWRCEICADYDVCNSCFHKDGGVDHPHKLTNHPSTEDCDAQNKEGRQKEVTELRKMLDLLVHASQCPGKCSYLNCGRVKALFRHGYQCIIQASRGCNLCRKMWYLLKLHAQECKKFECRVPRCRDLQEHIQRFQPESDSDEESEFVNFYDRIHQLVERHSSRALDGNNLIPDHIENPRTPSTNRD